MPLDPMRRIRWGMIGTGSVAQHKSGPAYALAQGSELVAVASRTAESARTYAARHGVAQVFATPTDLIHSAAVDAVYIATPPSSHIPLALAVANAGKPCCIEKPMALCYRDALAALQAFEAAALPLFVAYYRRSLPRFLQIAEWLRAGAIGTVRAVDWRLHRTAALAATASNWRVDANEAPGGLFEDLACHGLDLFDFLLGPVLHVERATLEDAAGAVPHRVEAAWHHRNGVVGQGIWDFAARERADVVTFTGDAGRIRCAMFDEAPVVLTAQGRSGERVIPNPVPIQLHHVEHMVAHLNGAAQHPSTAQSAIRTAWVMEQILRGPMAVRSTIATTACVS